MSGITSKHWLNNNNNNNYTKKQTICQREDSKVGEGHSEGSLKTAVPPSLSSMLTWINELHPSSNVDHQSASRLRQKSFGCLIFTNINMYEG